MMETRYRGSSRRQDDGFDFGGLPNPSIYNDRARRGSKYRRDNEPPISSLLIVILFILASFFFGRYIDFKLPAPLTAKDVAENPKR